ncbi:hypothetical protein C8F01DRAFT_1371788 [Mycena amicta]|nr:hypothetical protein C8F01DRAFT_1371788 [Mycena amicta]
MSRHRPSSLIPPPALDTLSSSLYRHDGLPHLLSGSTRCPNPSALDAPSDNQRPPSRYSPSSCSIPPPCFAHPQYVSPRANGGGPVSLDLVADPFYIEAITQDAISSLSVRTLGITPTIGRVCNIRLRGRPLPHTRLSYHCRPSLPILDLDLHLPMSRAMIYVECQCVWRSDIIRVSTNTYAFAFFLVTTSSLLYSLPRLRPTLDIDKYRVRVGLWPWNTVPSTRSGPELFTVAPIHDSFDLDVCMHRPTTSSVILPPSSLTLSKDASPYNQSSFATFTPGSLSFSAMERPSLSCPFIHHSLDSTSSCIK